VAWLVVGWYCGMLLSGHDQSFAVVSLIFGVVLAWFWDVILEVIAW
jgi:hypothetical protein